jgi:hypothetical protein
MAEQRLKIKAIQNDSTLSASEKSKEIQKLMSSNYKITDIDITKCNHYPHKKCNKFYFSCCNTFASCLRCHNESASHKPILKYITCVKCNLIQSPSAICIDDACKTVFSTNYCSICFIWTDKPIVHCNDCGICRVCVEGSIYHCKSCDACFDIKHKDSHKCVNKSYREQVCAYCIESTHTAQDSSVSLKCGHLVHNMCLVNATKSHMYNCPTCRKSIYDIDWTSLRNLIAMQPMPEEDIHEEDIVECTAFGGMLFRVTYISGNMYTGVFTANSMIRGTFVKEALRKPLRRADIYCNDCDKKSNVLFHYLGNECLECGSFNTAL